MPSEAEKKNAEERGAKAWFPQVGSWFVSKKGDTFFKLDMFPDQMFMLSKPREQEVDQTEDIPF